MKALIVIGIVYAVSIIIAYSLGFAHRRSTGRPMFENKWWHIALVLFAPIFVLLIPFFIPQLVREKKQERLQEQKSRDRKEQIEEDKRISLGELERFERVIVDDSTPLYWTAVQLGASVGNMRYKEVENVILDVVSDTIDEHLDAIKSHTKSKKYAWLEGDDKLQVELCKEGGMGGRSRLYIGEKLIVKDYNIFNRLRFDHSVRGAWCAYLIFKVWHYLPLFWHAGYDERQYLYSHVDLTHVHGFEKKLDLSGLDIDVTPYVYWGGDRAYISCCFWNNWTGIVRELIRVEFDGNRVKEIKDIQSEVLYPYDCGVCF